MASAEDVPSFLADVAERLVRYLSESEQLEQPVLRLRSPAEILAAFSDSGAPLPITGECNSLAALKASCEQILRFSVNTRHPLFLNQLYARADPIGVAGDWITTALHTNVHTFEVAPVLVLVEQEVLRKVASVVAGEYAEKRDGLFVPGGSISNLYGMLLARHKALPHGKSRGLSQSPPLVAFCSEMAHYSIAKAASVMGIGTDNLIKVATDPHGRLLPSALDAAVTKAKESGQLPFVAVLVAGTTVSGSIDNLEECGAVARRHGLWVHVDACWAGAALLSPKHRALVSGIEQADSISWNPHKFLCAPHQCSVFLTKHLNMLASCNSQSATYLFQADKLNADLDPGDKSIVCGRLGDALKLYMMWKHYGDAELARRVDHGVSLAIHLAARVQQYQAEDGRFVLSFPPSWTNVVFWYVPPCLRPVRLDDVAYCQRLARVAPLIKRRMQVEGDLMIGYQPLLGLPNAFRAVIMSPLLTLEHVDLMLRKIEILGASIREAEL